MENNTIGSKSVGKYDIYENLHGGITFLKVHYACAISSKATYFTTVMRFYFIVKKSAVSVSK